MKNLYHLKSFIVCITICAFFITTIGQAQTVTDPSVLDPSYDASKAALVSNPLKSSIPVNSLKTAGPTPTPTDNWTGGCLIPYDGDFIPIPRNDDGSYGPIDLPFNFDLYGDTYDHVFINTNGNISFDNPISTYSSSGFPYSTPMVAPFWGDVDTRHGEGQIWYKLSSSNLIVTWDGVDYYGGDGSGLTNTFQVIISTFSDGLTGTGNNISFYYADMQWTTGTASGGTGGFGGTPATVGVNKGDDITSFQLGRFNQNNDEYDGPDGEHDGVNYLDNRCIDGDVSTGDIDLGFEDNTPPTVITKNITVELDENGEATITPEMVNDGSYDNVGIFKLMLNKTSFTCADLGQNEVTLNVRDGGGNMADGIAIVTVIDNISPFLELVNGPIVLQRMDGHHDKFDIRELVMNVRDNADACSGNLTLAIYKASSDEPDDAQGNQDGSTVNDIIISGDGREINLRAESDIRGNGRVYTVYIRVTDASGNSTEKSLLVTANKRGRYPAVNDGAAHWVFPGAPQGQTPALQTIIDQNTPNPFKTKTLIKFSLENDEFTNLAIYDMAGQLVKTLVSEVKLAGEHTVEWQADDNNGERVPPGMYIYVFKTNEKQFSKKMLLLK